MDPGTNIHMEAGAEAGAPGVVSDKAVDDALDAPGSAQGGDASDVLAILNSLLNKMENDEDITRLSRMLKGISKDQIDKPIQDGLTALHIAASQGLVRAAEELLKANAGISIRDGDERQPLHHACVRGKRDVAKLLIEKEADINAMHDEGGTPLDEACWKGHLDVVELLLDQKKIDTMILDNAGWSPLYTAARYGQSLVVDLLLRKDDSRLNFQQTEDRWTALHAAAWHGYEKTVDVLLERGAELGSIDANHRTPLMVATQQKHKAVMRKLLKKRKQDEDLQLESCDARGQEKDEGLQLESRDGRGQTPLMWAAANGFLEGVRLLIEAKADPNPQGEKGPSVIYSAISEGHTEVADLLFEHELKKEAGKTAERLAKECHYNNTKTDLILGWAVGHIKRHSIAAKVISSRYKNSESYMTAADENNAIKWATYARLPPVLWLLIAASPRTDKTRAHIKSAEQLLKVLAGGSQHQLISEETQNGYKTSRPHSPKEQQLLQELRDILNDPPIALTCIDTQTYSEPNVEKDKILGEFEATVVQFYKEPPKSASMRKIRDVWEVIYGKGPKDIMDEAVQSTKKIFSSVKSGATANPAQQPLYIDSKPRFTWVHLPSTNMVWMNDLLQRIMHDEGYEPNQFYQVRSFLKDSWVEVPDRISKSRMVRPRYVKRRDEKESKTDETGTSSSMAEKDDSKSADRRKKGEDSNREEKAKTKDAGTDQKTRHKGVKKERDFTPVTAIYIPYLSYCTEICEEDDDAEDEEEEKGKGNWNGDDPPPTGREPKDQGKEELQKLKNWRKKYQSLLDAYKGLVIHGSSTLDESYYHFAEDSGSTEDRKHRNKNQVVTKGVREGTSIHWPLIRVNQLWAWTLDHKWLITASTHPIDGDNNTFLEGFLDHLVNRAEAGGSRSQPGSTEEMSRLLVDYCIGFYERRPRAQKGGKQTQDEEKSQDNTRQQGKGGKGREQEAQETGKPEGEEPLDDKEIPVPLPEGLLSIRQMFAHAINTIGRNETKLFEDFSSLADKWREQMDKNCIKKRQGGDEADWARSLEQELGVTIKEARKLSSDIKDIRDELNILKATTQYQQTVQGRMNGDRAAKAGLTATDVVNDIKEMDSVADRIQAAVHNTISLQENETANRQATLSVEQGREAVRQGRTLMVFTVVTILFLPLSFLSSLFALDVTSFQQAPGWAFGVIFAVSVTLFSPLAGYAMYSQQFDRWLGKRWLSMKHLLGFGNGEEDGLHLDTAQNTSANSQLTLTRPKSTGGREKLQDLLLQRRKRPGSANADRAKECKMEASDRRHKYRSSVSRKLPDEEIGD